MYAKLKRGGFYLRGFPFASPIAWLCSAVKLQIQNLGGDFPRSERDRLGFLAYLKSNKDFKIFPFYINRGPSRCWCATRSQTPPTAASTLQSWGWDSGNRSIWRNKCIHCTFVKPQGVGGALSQGRLRWHEAKVRRVHRHNILGVRMNLCCTVCGK